MLPSGLLVMGILAHSLMHSGDAQAEPRRKRVAECADAAEQAQNLRRDGHPVAARKLALSCAQEDCPKVVRQDCQSWVTELASKVGSLVVRARDPNGTALVPTEVLVDRQPSEEALSGNPVELDPGEHVLEVRVAQRKPVELRVTIAANARVNRIVDVPAAEPAVTAPILTPTPTKDATTPSRPFLPTPSWIAFGVSAAALGSFAYFGITGNAKVHELRGQCAPACSDDDLSPARASHLVADISLGVALVGAAVGTWLVVRRDRSATSAAVVPTHGGAAAFLRREF